MIKGYISLSNFTTLYYNQGEFDKYSKHLKVASLIYDVVILPADQKTIVDFNARLAMNFGIPITEINNTFISEKKVSTNLPGVFSKEIDAVLRHFSNNDKVLYNSFTSSLKNEFLQDGNFNSLKEMEAFENEYPLYHARDYGASLMSAMSTAVKWSIISNRENCNFLSSNNSTIIASRYLREQNVKATENIYSNIELLIPSMSNISWAELFEIKKDKRINQFREYLNEKIYSNQNSDEFAKDILLDLWKAFNELKIDAKTEIFTGIMGNIPIPIVNPISIYSSANSIKKAVRINRKYKPIYFLGHINDVLRKSSS